MMNKPRRLMGKEMDTRYEQSQQEEDSLNQRILEFQFQDCTCKITSASCSCYTLHIHVNSVATCFCVFLSSTFPLPFKYFLSRNLYFLHAMLQHRSWRIYVGPMYGRILVIYFQTFYVPSSSTLISFTHTAIHFSSTPVCKMQLSNR